MNSILNLIDETGITRHYSAKGTRGRQAIVEPAFFEVRDTVFSAELGERLVSECKQTQGKKSATCRLAFFEDIETGAVLGLPAWYYFRDGKKIFATGPLPGQRQGQSLEKLVTGGRFYPVASVRLVREVDGTDPANVLRWDNAREFEDQFLTPMRARFRQNASYVLLSESAMQAQGFNQDGETIELAGPEPETDPNELLASALADFLPDVAPSDLNAPSIERALVRAHYADPAYADALRAGFRAILRQICEAPEVYGEFLALDREKQAQRLFGALAERINERIRAMYHGPEQTPLSQAIPQASSAGIWGELLAA